MAFFDNFESIRGFATNAAQSAAGKTKKLAAIAKANFNILAEEEKVKKLQLELGKVFYKNFISGEEGDMAEYLPLCEKITASLKLIDDLKEEIAQARGTAAEAAPEADDFTIEEEPAADEPEAPEAPEAPEEPAADEPEAPEAPAE